MKMKIRTLIEWCRMLRNRSSIMLMMVAVLLFEVTAGVQYWFAGRGIQRETQHRAETELRLATLHIQSVMREVEVATDNMVWWVNQNLDDPDSIYIALRQLVTQNSTIVGCGMGFVADYYDTKGRWYEPYVAQRAEDSIEVMQIGSASHDYLNADWFNAGLNSDDGVWTEPYYDEAGARMMLCTYAHPIRDAKGRVVAVLGADVSLDWLSAVANSRPIYPGSYNVILSRQGQIMACPVESLVMQRSSQEVVGSMKDTSVNSVNRNMLAGESGHATMYDDEGNKNYVFYAPVQGGTGWSMAVVCSDREIYYGLRQVAFNLTLLMILGFLLMAYILVRGIRNFNTIQAVSAERERMSSELRIANGIQMGMLPKTFPPFPERDDVEVHAVLHPAKEVGGDFYDFFIRDEKLFFCIGDVSGKGVPASLVMAVTRSLFRSVSAREASTGRIVENMNLAMAEMNDSNMFVTLFVGVLDLPTGRLHYCNAGHCPPLLLGYKVGQLPVESNIPVGLVPEWKYVAQEAMIMPGTTIFLYTDGLTEAENLQHQLFGDERVMETAQNLMKQPSLEVVNTMTDAVRQFVGEAEQSDDLTLLAVRYTKPYKEEFLSSCLTLKNDVQDVPHLSAFVDEVAERVGFDPAMTMKLNLAVEEAVVNVMNYAYPQGTVGNINVEACANDERLKFIITDSGRPFDPTAIAEADTSLTAEERPIGGLGIFLVRQLMDSINYEYVDGHNVLTLRKKLHS